VYAVLFITVLSGIILLAGSASRQEVARTIGRDHLLKARILARNLVNERIARILQFHFSPVTEDPSHLLCFTPVSGQQDGFDYTVISGDTAGKLNMNSANASMLYVFCSPFCADDTQTFIDSLFDFRDSDDLLRESGAEQAFYMQQGRPCLPLNRNLLSPCELKAVNGMRPGAFYRDNMLFGGLGSFFTAFNPRNTLAPDCIPLDILERLGAPAVDGGLEAKAVPDGMRGYLRREKTGAYEIIVYIGSDRISKSTYWVMQIDEAKRSYKLIYTKDRYL